MSLYSNLKELLKVSKGRKSKLQPQQKVSGYAFELAVEMLTETHDYYKAICNSNNSNIIKDGKEADIPTGEFTNDYGGLVIEWENGFKLVKVLITSAKLFGYPCIYGIISDSKGPLTSYKNEPASSKTLAELLCWLQDK